MPWKSQHADPPGHQRNHIDIPQVEEPDRAESALSIRNNSSDDMWGNAPVWVSPGEQVQVSDLERTILDGLARPELCGGVSEVVTGLLIRKDDLDWEKLAEYTSKVRGLTGSRQAGRLPA